MKGYREAKVVISIIMPVYNCANYLDDCINSLTIQTFKNFEIICVNDHSSDESLKILEAWKLRDQRISVLNLQKRIGAAKCRNLGMSTAVGKYFIFLDSDDIFSPNLLEELYTAANKHDADVVFAENDSFVNENEIVRNFVIQTEGLNKYSDHVFSIKDMPKTAFEIWKTTPWNKLVRGDFIRHNGIEFQDIPCSNDVLFSDLVLLLAERVIHTKSQESLIHYRTGRKGQISYRRDPFCILKALDALRKRMISEKMWNEYEGHYWIHFFSRITDEMSFCSKEESRRFYNGLKNLLPELKSIRNNEALETTYRELENKILNEAYTDYWTTNYDALYRKLNFMNLKIEKLFQYINRNGYVPAFWGAGKAGVTFVKFCTENGYMLPVIIDNDRSKDGKYIDNTRISSFNEAENYIDIVLVSNPNFMSAICRQIYSSKQSVKVMALYLFLNTDSAVEECLVMKKETGSISK